MDVPSPSTRAADARVLLILDRTRPPAFCSLLEEPGQVLNIDGERFEYAGLGDWIGFYDWLRLKSGEVIGVRLWPDDANAHLRQATACANVELGNGGMPMDIYLGDERAFDPWMSDDQDFGGNQLMVSATRYAMTFNAPTARVVNRP